MATGLFGVSWTEIIDFLLKLAPAASIVGGILAARVQLRSNRQINAVMIAKNHYREMLDAFLKNSDILYLGSNPTSFAELKKDIPRYRRYRTLFTLMSFAMQELYLAMDLKREKNWEHMIRVFISLFRNYILSPEDYNPYNQQALTPSFLAFLMDTAQNFEHSAARTSVAQYLKDETRLT
jgi:hypothetical protein